MSSAPAGRTDAGRSRQAAERRRGQSLIESCFAIALIGFLLLGALQLSQWLAATEVLHHAASRGARAKTVGFNRWMVNKAVDVATIPNAGRMITPPFENQHPQLRALLENAPPGQAWDYALATTPGSPQYALERGRIPEYMAAENRARARFILDYAEWDTVSVQVYETDASGDGTGAQTLHVRARQDYRLWVPMHRAFYGADRVTLTADTWIENHYPLYLEDRDW